MRKNDLTRAGLPTRINANLEAGESSHAIELAAWETHKHIYMMLSNSMAKRIRPAVDWIAANEGHSEAIKYCHEVLPDCIERSLMIHHLINTDQTKTDTE